MLKVCVVGAGAIGGFLGTRLATLGDTRVSALARGTTLVALRDHGWRLEEDGALVSAPAALASDDPRALGPQDLVILTVKAPALPPLAPSLRPLLQPHTMVLPAMNGVPWWFGDGIAALAGKPLESVDPGGGIAAAIPTAQVIGCVVHASATQKSPGVAQHRMGRATHHRGARRRGIGARAGARRHDSRAQALRSSAPRGCVTTSGTSSGAT